LRDGVTASFLTGHLSEMCTGARGKNGNKPFWLVAYSRFCRYKSIWQAKTYALMLQLPYCTLMYNTDSLLKWSIQGWNPSGIELRTLGWTVRWLIGNVCIPVIISFCRYNSIWQAKTYAFDTPVTVLHTNVQCWQF
jgi:hypothetical protein